MRAQTEQTEEQLCQANITRLRGAIANSVVRALYFENTGRPTLMRICLNEIDAYKAELAELLKARD